MFFFALWCWLASSYFYVIMLLYLHILCTSKTPKEPPHTTCGDLAELIYPYECLSRVWLATWEDGILSFSWLYYTTKVKVSQGVKSGCDRTNYYICTSESYLALSDHSSDLGLSISRDSIPVFQCAKTPAICWWKRWEETCKPKDCPQLKLSASNTSDGLYRAWPSNVAWFVLQDPV